MVTWNINIPAELAFRFETLYMDTGKHKPVYGKKSEVISALLSSHISEIEQQLAKGEA